MTAAGTGAGDPGGPGAPAPDLIEPVQLAVPQAELDDLAERLRRTRWPEPAPDAGQGVALSRVQELCEHWADGYDWRATEARLNAAPQFLTRIGGLPIHFLHARCDREDATPLLLTHGWPGWVAEYLDVLGPLTDAGFSCVVPSLPGYGFSGRPGAPGWGVQRIAGAWAVLMARLGYRRYLAQGTDWGTSATACLAQADPAHVAGILLMPPLVPPAAEAPTVAERADREAVRAGRRDAGGYSLLQQTRPQTIGYSLVDSPAGLAAWITEKVDAWSDPRSPIPTDRLLDLLMLYWLPRPERPPRACTPRASTTSPGGWRVRCGPTTSSARPPAA